MDVFRQILTKYWGYSNFRPLQEDIIRSVYEGNDTLGLMPTGGGKSITFQVPALAKDGICLVISPLIALMKDQVENLKKRKIKAAAIYTGMTRDELDVTLNNCIYGDYKFLYISPERIATELFQHRVKDMNVNLLAVDESHCISQWGYDFRPSYLKIADIRDILTDVPILALTATATPEVVNDIQDKLHFKKKNVFQKSFERKNLLYIVRQVEDKQKHLLKIATSVNGTGVVYARNRKKTQEIASFLVKNGISADFYHAGLENKIRDQKQSAWKTDKCRIIVATNAFGMGIDKDDVRFVVHMDLPDSLEAYFQEAGRAGRDEKKAYAILLYNDSDRQKIEQRIRRSFPEIKEIKEIYHALGNYYQLPIGAGKGSVFDFNLYDFASVFKKDVVLAYNALMLLQYEGYIELTDELDNPSRIHFKFNRDDLYKFQVANAELDGIIKLILRSYTGVFNDYVAIDELSLAKKAKIEKQVIIDFLKRLNNLGVIRYIMQKKTPLLVFTEERLDEGNLYFSPENYKIRKERYVSRIETVLHYASTKSKCRSQMLLSYFGDKDPYRCGQCDVCTSRNRLDLSNMEFDQILEIIKKELTDSPKKLDDVVDLFSDNEQKVIKVIQWLIDTDKIISEDGLLKWNRKNNTDCQ